MAHMDYYYVQPHDVDEKQVIIRENELHHLINVSRHKKGDTFFAVDGQGHSFECTLLKAQGNRGEAAIISTRLNVGESPFELTIAQPPPKGSRFDFTVEKGTEIGVRRFVPMSTERSRTIPVQKIERWRNIAKSAMKQSGRSVLPEITEPCTFNDVLEQFQSTHIRLIAHEGKEVKNTIVQTIKRNVASDITSGIVLIGPEGGFSESEVNLAEKNGFKPVLLGPRRLRSETAGIVVASLLISFLEY